MPASPQMQHPIPEENQTPWYDAFVSLILSMDAADFSARDDRNIAITGGGTFTAALDGTVSWDEALSFFHGSTGFNGVLAADPTGILLEDGDSVYVDAVRGPSGAYTLATTKTAGALPGTDKSYLLLHRSGDIVWVRHLGPFALGAAIGSGVFPAGEKLITVVPLVVNRAQGDGLLTMGRLRLNVADYALAGATMTLNLRVESQVTVFALPGEIEFYDATAGDVLKASTTIATDQPAQFEAVFTPEDTTSDRVYEFRAGLNSAGGPYGAGDEVIVWNAAIEIINTF